MDNKNSKHETFKQHPVNPKILDIVIQTIDYDASLVKATFHVLND